MFQKIKALFKKPDNKPPAVKDSKAKSDGYVARLAGILLIDNPWNKPESISALFESDWQLWRDGWEQAKQDQENLMGIEALDSLKNHTVNTKSAAYKKGYNKGNSFTDNPYKRWDQRKDWYAGLIDQKDDYAFYCERDDLLCQWQEKHDGDLWDLEGLYEGIGNWEYILREAIKEHPFMTDEEKTKLLALTNEVITVSDKKLGYIKEYIQSKGM